MLSENLIIAPGAAPAGNINATFTTTYLHVRGGNFVNWLYQHGTGGTNTGRQTVTVVAAQDNAGTGAVAVPFRNRKKTVGNSDQWGPVVEVAATGFQTAANETTIYEVEVDPAVIQGAGVTGRPWVALRSTQLVADTVPGAVVALVQDPRFAGQTIPTILT
ncbi:MAG: hypothetical protein K2X87_09260 [Gemmataceae bacterium]|nr:hypothetical protein [Gemmataceae bacterium]